MMKLVRGSVSGLIGTVLMTAALYAARWLGLMSEEPPKQITKNAERKASVSPHSLPRPVFQASWIGAHVGYGAASGVGYTLVRSLLPRGPALAGLIYGEALWAVNYLGLMPALGLYPDPSRDRSSRTVVMIAAHAIFGVTVAEAAERL